MTEIDGFRGWVVVTAAFCSHTITFGIIYSFGIIFRALEEHFNGSKAEMAWIPSLTTGFLHSAGLLASVLVSKFGCRVVSIIGALACSTGYVLSIFAPNIYYMYVTMGILSGCGFGLVFMPSVLIVTQYFKKFRSVACGMALSGCGIGAFIFSPMTKALLDEYSLQGTLLLLSAIILNCIPCALMYRPVATRRRTMMHTDKKHEDELQCLYTKAGQNINYMVTKGEDIELVGNESERNNCKPYISENISADENNTISYCKMPVIHTSDETEKENVEESVIYEYIENHGKCHMRLENIKSMSTTARYVALLKKPTMLIVFVSQFLFVFGFYLPFIFIPDNAKGLGISDKISAWIISVIGISSICGRIVLGCIADKPSVNRLMMFNIFLLIGGISTALSALFNNIWLMMIYAVIFGVSTGFTISVTSVILLDLVGFEYLTDALGIVSLFSGLGSVLGPPVAGILYDSTGSYTVPFLTSGASLAFSGVLMFLTAICP